MKKTATRKYNNSIGWYLMNNGKRYISPWIFTTENCNLRCPYCYVKRTNKIMSGDTWSRINDKFIGMIERGEVDNVIYRLAGGEPLLVFNHWKGYIADFLYKSGENGFVSIISNMVLLEEEMIDFFDGNRFGFGISLDGFEYSKPLPNGLSSASIVKNNIDRLISKRGSSHNIDISTVINKDAFDDLDKLAEWIADRNLGWGIYLDHFFCGEMPLKIIIEKMIQVVDILASKGFDIYNNFKFNNIKLSSSYEGCTAGEKLLAISVDGGIHPCQTAIYNNPICSIYDDSNIIDEFKKQKQYKLGYNLELPKKCEECSISKMCGGGCKLNNKEINKNYTCDIMKIVLCYVGKKYLEVNKNA